MDPESSYVLKIKLLGNCKKARKDVICFSFEKIVDSDTINFKDFVESVIDKYPPCYIELAHVRYYDADLKTFPIVTTYQELMVMFEKYINTKVVHMFIAYSGFSEPYQPITQWESYATNTQPQPDQSQPNSTQSAEDSYLPNPLPENEHVGIDEETIYLTNNDPVDALDVVVFCDNKKNNISDEDEESDI
ncbi:hypothetical protein GQ55_9G252700 [Panicum hallii var. hallii]|uniref:Uncharacterized protein n=1 Tax=Panicum hallii var. hallii TaxID=1504633 RepID=A0A2T7C6X0_9POAL|nr:hypothetical protein GQ55_9G252700 [Panicum hallii var. hallii]